MKCFVAYIAGSLAATLLITSVMVDTQIMNYVFAALITIGAFLICRKKKR